MNDWEKKFALALKSECGIDLDTIDAVIRAGRAAKIEPLEPTINARRYALTLFIRGFHEDAMLAARAMFEAANGLHNATVNAKPLEAGKKVIAGGKRGASKTNGKRVAEAKRPAIEAAIKAFEGNSRSMASIIAKRHEVSAKYVRAIKAELALA